MEIRLTEHGPHIAVITIDNQPRRNAMTREMMAELARIWEELSESNHRCVVLTGAGSKAFSSGADLSGDLSASPEMAAMINRALLKHGGFTKPIVAAVNGDCVAGGVELMISCDIRAAAPTARLGLPEVKWGIYPFGGAAVKLIHQIGHVHALDLLLTARLIGAEEARDMGLINAVVSGGELMDWALGRAEMIAANSPVAVRAVKRQIEAIGARSTEACESLEQTLGDDVRASADHKEGVAAFLEKRAPRYD